jgi:ketosteroid isomerase-like protein
MNTHVPETQFAPGREIELEREGLFARLTAAFMHRDFLAFNEAVREDVVMELPGSSWLAGTYEGRDAFGRFMVSVRQVVDSTKRPTTYLHYSADEMIVRHEMLVSGPKHEVEMVLVIKIRFDTAGMVAAVVVVPEDLGLFDHVANSTRKYFQALEATLSA